MDLAAIAADLNPWWREPAQRLARGFPFRRDLHQEVLRRVLDIGDRRAVVVAGPRQVGKTVLLRQLADDLLDRDWPSANIAYFDFSDYRLTDSVDAEKLFAFPELGTRPDAPRVLLLDEISLAFNFDLWLKHVVDSGERHHPAGLRIVATDSSASLLHRASRDSGQGRWDQLSIGSLVFSEFLRMWAGTTELPLDILRANPSLHDRYLALGGFPKHVRAEVPSRVRAQLRDDTVDRAVRRDLERLGEVDERAIRLFIWFAQESGSILNKEKRAADLEADPRTIDKWLRWLEETALLVALGQSTGVKASSRLRAKPKIYAADPGLVGAFTDAPPDSPEVRAKVVETAVFRHLRELPRRLDARLGYFRLSDELELDFVLDAPGRRVGVEVTTSSTLKADRRSRMNRAAEKLGLDELFLVYEGFAGEEVRTAAGSTISLLPLASFLLNPQRVLEGRSDG